MLELLAALIPILNTMLIIGFDLVEVETRATGCCKLINMKVETSLI